MGAGSADPGATKIPDAHGVGLPHIRPWSEAAAALTAQWQAADTSQVRPCAMSSKAPLRTDERHGATGWTEGQRGEDRASNS